MKSIGEWVAELARPFTFYTLAIASSASIVKLAWGLAEAMEKGTADGYQAAALAGVVLAGASAIYIGKSFENKWNASAQVEMEKAKAAPLVVSDGELPPDQRVKL